MASERGLALLAIVCCCGWLSMPQPVTADFDVDSILLATDLARELLRDVAQAWKILDEVPALRDLLGAPGEAEGGVAGGLGGLFGGSKLHVAARQLKSLQGQVERLGEQQRESALAMADAHSKMWRDSRLERNLHELAKHAHAIDRTFGTALEFAKNATLLENSTVIGFAEATVSYRPGSMRSHAEGIHSLIATPSSQPNDRTSSGNGLIRRSIMVDLMKALKESDTYVCEFGQSQNQLLYDMFNTILVSQMKAFAVMETSWMLLKLYGKGNFTYERQMSRARYENVVNETVTAAKEALAEADRVLWRCDPPKHVEGTTYEQVTRLLQGYVENEVDMNKDNTCGETCGYYEHAQNSGCYKDEFCSNQPACQGKIMRCHFVDSDMSICLAPRNSNRRYEYIEFESTTYGTKKEPCRKGETKIKSWSRWLFWRCHYCVCICDQSGPLSDRYFSLKESVADLAKNRVVVGVKFAKFNRVLHLQIADGALLPGARVDSRSVEWRRVPDVDARRSTRGVDFHEMSAEERALDLDDVHAPRNDSLVTGVRLRKIGAHLNLEVRATPFDFRTGRLDGAKSVWIGNDNTASSEEPRTERLLLSPDVPTRTVLPSSVDSAPDQFVAFTHTDYAKDAAQTTVPFLDSQPVIPATGAVPLTGVGLYHKGAEGYGGFVAPRTFTYDYIKHVRVGEFERRFGGVEAAQEKEEGGNGPPPEVVMPHLEIITPPIEVVTPPREVGVAPLEVRTVRPVVSRKRQQEEEKLDSMLFNNVIPN